MDQYITQNQKEEEETIVLVHEKEVEELKEALPTENWLGCNKIKLHKFQNFWCSTFQFSGILNFQRHFQAQNTDLVVASFPKTGTTWLKSLLFSVVNRSIHPPKSSPLLNHNPHELVYDLESGVYGGNPKLPRPHQLNQLPSPRLLHSHLPYESLPESIKTSACKVVYICRNPFDTLVSHWLFYPNGLKKILGNEDFQAPKIEDFFEDFCQGNVLFGPFFDNAVAYWEQSIERPDKVLFLKYEDLKENPSFYLKKLAEFVGLPFSPLEEKDGVIEQIIELCSIGNLRELEVNKTGFLRNFVENKNFFREGKVGGWTHYFTPSMVEKMNKLMEHKLGGTGLSFKLQP